MPAVSRGYPPPRGRLPTCYAPVRHVTPPKGGPSDLHALGTPPALILSQDQTLHQDRPQRAKGCSCVSTGSARDPASTTQLLRLRRAARSRSAPRSGSAPTCQRAWSRTGSPPALVGRRRGRASAGRLVGGRGSVPGSRGGSLSRGDRNDTAAAALCQGRPRFRSGPKGRSRRPQGPGESLAHERTGMIPWT